VIQIPVFLAFEWVLLRECRDAPGTVRPMAKDMYLRATSSLIYDVGAWLRWWRLFVEYAPITTPPDRFAGEQVLMIIAIAM